MSPCVSKTQKPLYRLQRKFVLVADMVLHILCHDAYLDHLYECAGDNDDFIHIDNIGDYAAESRCR